jgi:hypothetical protein
VTVEAPPLGLRWRDEGPLSASLRPRRSRLFYVALLGALWNTAFALVVDEPPHIPSRFRVVASLATVTFTLPAVREALLVTRVTFADGMFRVVAGALAPWVRLELPLAVVRGFAVAEQADRCTVMLDEARRSGDVPYRS